VRHLDGLVPWRACRYRSLDFRQVLQVGYGSGQLLFIRKKPVSQTPSHTKAAVVSSAAAKANDDFVRAAPGRIQNHFANAEGGRANWIAFSFGKPPHAGSLAHLHHREFLSVDP